MLTDDELLALMKRVDPETKRVPPGVRAIANAIQATERERWRKALEYAISEADGWHDECHGGKIESEEMDAARAMLLA